MHRKICLLTQRFLLGSSLVVLGVGLLVQAPRVAARDAEETPAGRCTVRNVAGTYGFAGRGTVLPNALGLPEGPIDSVGLLTFDGQTQWRTTHQSLMVHGQAATMVSLAGTYTVESDCTFILFDEAGNLTDVGVFVSSRQEGVFMAAVEGVTLTFTMKRIDTHD